MRSIGWSLVQWISALRLWNNRVKREEHGGSLIETAVSVGTLLMFFMAIISGARIVYADIFVGAACRMATRYAMVRGSTFTGTSCMTTSSANCAVTSVDVSNYVKAIAPLGIMNGSPLIVVATWPGTKATGLVCATANGANSSGCIVTVQVTYNFNYALPFIAGTMLALRSQSSVTISQ